MSGASRMEWDGSTVDLLKHAADGQSEVDSAVALRASRLETVPYPLTRGFEKKRYVFRRAASPRLEHDYETVI